MTEWHLTLVRPARGASTYVRYFPALDGIRAVAVIAVLPHHFGAPYAAGGFLGLDLFFVLSGYLITCQLMTRWVNGPAITRHSFAVFLVSRARRRFPPLAAVLLCTSATVAIADRAKLSLFRGDVAAAATYVSNWWYIFHQRSYFAAAGRQPLLQHLWSLAVEEQFYLVWPVVILPVPAARGPNPDEDRADHSCPAPTTTQSMPPDIGGAGSMRLAVYGDSVPLGAMPELAERFATVTNHAVEAEQAWDPATRADRGRAGSAVDHQVVLLHTGDNGLIPQGDLDRALRVAGSGRTASTSR